MEWNRGGSLSLHNLRARNYPHAMVATRRRPISSCGSAAIVCALGWLVYAQKGIIIFPLSLSLSLSMAMIHIGESGNFTAGMAKANPRRFRNA